MASPSKAGRTARERLGPARRLGRHPKITVDQATRHVDFEACFNFRDLGGYQTVDGHLVRWATLYRSDTLASAHCCRRRRCFTPWACGRSSILRSLTEIDQFGRLGVGRADLTWHNVPMLDNVKLVAP